MVTNSPCTRRRLKGAEALALLEAAERAGTPLTAAARASGLEPYQLYDARRRRDRLRRRRKVDAFAEVEVVATRPEAAAGPLRVHFPNGLIVEVPAAADMAHLRRVLEAVKSC